MSQSEKLSLSEIQAALKREPLVSVAEASRIMGVSSSNFNRDHAGRLRAIELPTTGGRPTRLYFRSEVRRLARSRNGRH